jgi:enamine deaminase RidA (YjgF/YER057c/UK114 family)
VFKLPPFCAWCVREGQCVRIAVWAVCGGYAQNYKEFFPENPPARTTVGAGIAMEGALIEVELIATV